MKGVIVKCIEELVKKKFGDKVWEESLKEVGLSPDTIFLASDDVDDRIVLKLVKEVLPTKLGISYQEVCDAFGEYWMTQFAPKVYKVVFLGVKNAKEFLKRMDKVHSDLGTGNPPRFEYEEPDKDSLIMIYKSSRNLIELMIGLIKGVAKYFNEEVTVTRIAPNRVLIKFK